MFYVGLTMTQDIKTITSKIKKFRDDRDWMQFHDAKNMAISIMIEAAELLEHFQWKSKKEVQSYVGKNKSDIAEEIADIAIYLIEMADNMEIDIVEAINKKLKKNAERYPVKKSRGKHIKYNRKK